MTNVLSAISGQFNKSLILGTFLPVTIFVVLFQMLVEPLLPDDISIFKPLETLDTQWRIAATFFTIILLSGLLFNFNIAIIRIYEGYSWQHTRIGEWRTKYYQAQL